MTLYLFVDNFRGFKNTTIPIAPVNFLVGENSTGKTSLLGLLKLFSGSKFLFDQEFQDDDVGFGHFSEMVSAHAEDRTYFHVGVIWEEEAGDKTLTIGWLATFTEDRREHRPRLSRYTLCRSGDSSLLFSLRLSGRRISYRRRKSDKPLRADDIRSLLPQWAREHREPAEAFSRLQLPKGLPRKIPIMLALSFIGGIPAPSRRKPKGEEEEDYLFPMADVVFPPNIAWIAPVRTKPKRTYNELSFAFSPEGDHTPYLIRRMLGSRTDAKKFQSFQMVVKSCHGRLDASNRISFGWGFDRVSLKHGSLMAARSCKMGVFSNRVTLRICRILVETGLQAQPASWACDRHQHVHRDGDPKLALGLHGVLAGAVELLDPQVRLTHLKNSSTCQRER